MGLWNGHQIKPNGRQVGGDNYKLNTLHMLNVHLLGDQQPKSLYCPRHKTTKYFILTGKHQIKN